MHNFLEVLIKLSLSFIVILALTLLVMWIFPQKTLSEKQQEVIKDMDDDGYYYSYGGDYVDTYYDTYDDEDILYWEEVEEMLEETYEDGYNRGVEDTIEYYWYKED